MAEKQPPERQLRPLAQVPEEERKAIWEEATRKGWKALGYESFVEYGEKELNLGAARIYQLADAAEISLQLGFSKILEKQPTESHLVPLKSVPEEERKAIWEEATRKGWKALGYESFVEYGEKELNLASTHLYQLANAAEIVLQIGFSAMAEKQR